jgi:hypothetical protein
MAKAGKTRQFKLLRGLHSEGGKTYKPGDIINSASDLSRHNSRHSKKFARVGQQEELDDEESTSKETTTAS